MDTSILWKVLTWELNTNCNFIYFSKTDNPNFIHYQSTHSFPNKSISLLKTFT